MIGEIWTVGHSTRPLSELLDLLAENGIGVLVDVRSSPGSRRCPHFNREHLAVSVPAAGIEYAHILDLGGWRKTSAESRNTAWRNLSFRGYADHMETAAFSRGILRLEGIARDARACYMCSEAVWWQCHRSMISDHLKSRLWRVRHILGPGEVKDHTYTQPAKIRDGKLTYHP